MNIPFYIIILMAKGAKTHAPPTPREKSVHLSLPRTTFLISRFSFEAPAAEEVRAVLEVMLGGARAKSCYH
jgi:hypothetical protein